MQLSTLNRIHARSVGPKPTGHPVSYGRNKRAAFDDGWYAASDGVSVNAAPERPEWQREAWLAGHDAYHVWLQAHRVRACDRDAMTVGGMR